MWAKKEKMGDSERQSLLKNEETSMYTGGATVVPGNQGDVGVAGQQQQQPPQQQQSTEGKCAKAS